MAQMVEELLELSTIESGLRPMASERVPIADAHGQPGPSPPARREQGGVARRQRRARGLRIWSATRRTSVRCCATSPTTRSSSRRRAAASPSAPHPASAGQVVLSLPRHRRRDHPRGPAPDLRALLEGGQLAAARRRGLRARAGDRPPRRRSPRRHGDGHLRASPRHRVPGGAAGCRRRIDPLRLTRLAAAEGGWLPFDESYDVESFLAGGGPWRNAFSTSMRRRRSRRIRRCSTGVTSTCSTPVFESTAPRTRGLLRQMSAYHLGWTDAQGRIGERPRGQAHPPRALALGVRVARGRPGMGAPGSRRRRADPQLHADPRRHPGRRPAPPPSSHGVDHLGHRAGHQRRRRHVRQRDERPARPRTAAGTQNARRAPAERGRGPGGRGPVPRPLARGPRRRARRPPTSGWSP